MPEADREVLSFLWWPNGDTRAEPKDYWMMVHLFGGICSPSVCSYVMQQTAKDNREDFQPEVIDTVLSGFYVDNCLMSYQNEEAAIKMVTDLPNLWLDGGSICANGSATGKRCCKSCQSPSERQGFRTSKPYL